MHEFQKLFSNKAFLLFVTFFVFLGSISYEGSNLASKKSFAREIQSPVDNLMKWELGNKPPYKYRALFRWIVKGSWTIMFKGNNDRLYHIYIFWNFIFLAGTVFLLNHFLNILGFSQNYSIFGSLLFLACPAIFMAFSLPVHTREDFLGYFLLTLGLIFTVKKKLITMTLVAVLGVFCRETLLILPFYFLFFSDTPKFYKRILIAAIPIIVWVCFRIIYGLESYDYWEGFRWNLENLEQVAGFFFITFGALWLPFFVNLLKLKTLCREVNNAGFRSLLKASPWVLSLVFVMTFLGGIFNEIRLMFLIFPWVIPLSLLFFRKYYGFIKIYFTQRNYMIFIVILSTFTIYAIIWSLHNFEYYLESSKYNIPFQQWIIVALVNLFFMIAFSPICLTVLIRQAPVKTE